MRAATTVRHALLDARLAIAADDADARAVAAHLALLLAWMSPMQRWLAAYADGPQDFRLLAPRDRVAELREDLARLVDTAGVADAPAHDDRPWPAQASPAYRWGVAYVVEGSCLGGRVLARRLAPALGGVVLRSLADTDEVSARWRVFLAAFDAALRDESAIDAACVGASDAFDHLLALAGLPGDAP